jgi:hypothetical protein
LSATNNTTDESEMEQETRYQRIAREQRERQAARADRMDAEQKAKAKAIRAQRKPMRMRHSEVSDFDYSMNG